MAGRALSPARTVRLRAPDGPVQVRVWAGEPDPAQGAPALLAFHGWTDSADVFAPLVRALDGAWNVLAPDAPAHGGTPLREGPFVIAAHAVSAIAVLDALVRLTRTGSATGRGSRTVVAYGHGMGALTAARVAVARPAPVRALVLEEPSRTTLRRTQSSERMLTWMRGLRSGDHASRLAWARANHPHWPREELEPWARSKELVDLEHLTRAADWGEPLAALLSEVHCPVLIIRGEPARGGIVSRTGARRCAAACPGGAQVLALDAGHSPRREAGGAVATALRQILTDR